MYVLALNGDTVVSAGNPDPVVWRIADGKLIERGPLKREGLVECFALSRDGKNLAVGVMGRGIAILDVERLAPPLVIEQGTRAERIAYSPDSALLASYGLDPTPAITVWDAASGRKLRSWPVPGVVENLQFSADGRHLLTANYNGTIYVLRLGHLRQLVREPAAARVGPLGRGPAPRVPKSLPVRTGVSPDGKTLVTGHDSGKVMLWDLVAGKLRQVLEHHRGPVQPPSGPATASISPPPPPASPTRPWHSGRPTAPSCGHSGSISATTLITTAWRFRQTASRSWWPGRTGCGSWK